MCRNSDIAISTLFHYFLQHPFLRFLVKIHLYIYTGLIYEFLVILFKVVFQTVPRIRIPIVCVCVCVRAHTLGLIIAEC